MDSNYKHIKFTDVLRFLLSKAKNPDCPTCETNDWEMQYVRVENEPDLIFGALGLVVGIPFSFEKGHEDDSNVKTMPFAKPTIPLMCKNCGHIRLHDYAVVSTWVRENPADEASS